MPQVPSAQAMMARDEASRGLGIELVDHAEGRAVTRMTVRGRHGERARGRARRPDLHPGGHGVRLRLQQLRAGDGRRGGRDRLCRPRARGDVLTAEAVVRTRFGRAGVYDVTVRRGGDVIAEFRGRSHELARPRAGSAE